MKPKDGECQLGGNPLFEDKKKNIPRPPTISTAGFFASAIWNVKDKKASPQVQEDERGERRRTGERRGAD